MLKNVASQKVTFLAIDTATNLPKTGDAANLTAYVSKDDGSVTVLNDTSAAELDATNAPGLYSFDLTQTETNADKLVFSGKSSTSGVRLVPITVYPRPVGWLRASETIYVGTVTGATTATSLVDSGLTQGATDHWNRRVIIFRTGILAGQASHITAFTPASDTLTFDAFTDAPSAGDTYVIV